MIEYIYRGFKISYEVSKIDQRFEAKGVATQLLKKPKIGKLLPEQALEESYFLAEDKLKRKLEQQIDKVLAVYFQHESSVLF